MPKLHVLQGPDKGRTYQTANEPGLIIGRSADPIQLTDQSASRRHAEIFPQNGHWMLVDLNSSNGTYLNGQRVIAPARLKDGDQIKVGNTLLVFAEQDSGAPAAGLPPVSDLLDFEFKNPPGGSSLLSSFEASQDSVILQPPETADAVAAWNIAYEIAQLIGTTPTVQEFLERTADIITAYMLVDHLVVLTGPPESDDLTPRVTRVRGVEGRHRVPVVTSSAIIRHVLTHRDGVLSANVQTDDRFSEPSTPESLHDLAVRSIICVPIIAGNQMHGVIHFDCARSNHTYTQEQLRLAVAMGRLVGMAIENSRLMESRVKNERLAAVGETVAYLSHHIRNILQGLQGGADVLELGFRKGRLETAQSGWGLVRRNLDRIFDLTMNMLTFSKQRQPRIQSANVNKVVVDVVALAQSRADEKGVALGSELEEIPAVPLDAEGMHQAVLNIVNNAIEAAPPQEGKVHLRTHYHIDSGEVVLTIRDNGPGISAAERSRIFEPFHSGKGQSGTGLGLAAARKIVEELGGQIELTDEDPGATFHIRIPAVHVQLADSDKTHGPAH